MPQAPFLGIVLFLATSLQTSSGVAFASDQVPKEAPHHQRLGRHSLNVVVEVKGVALEPALQDRSKMYQWAELLSPTNVPNWVLALLSGLAAFLAFRSLRAIQQQAETMVKQNAFALDAVNAAKAGVEASLAAVKIATSDHIASNRPWVSIGNVAVTSLITEPNGDLYLFFDFNLQNHGRNPALNYVADAEGFFVDETTAHHSRMRPLRDQLVALQIRKTSGENASGEACFPDETSRQSTGVRFKVDDIAKHTLGDSGFMAPFVVICVVYTSSVTGETHATSSIYTLCRINRPQETSPMGKVNILLKYRDLDPSDQLVLALVPGNGLAY